MNLIEQFPEGDLVSGVGIYSASSAIYRDRFRGTYTYPEKEILRHTLHAITDTDRLSYSQGWTTLIVEGKPYLLRVYGGQGDYFFALINFPDMDHFIYPADSSVSRGCH